MAKREIDMSVPCKNAFADWLLAEGDDGRSYADHMDTVRAAFAAGWQARKEATYRALVLDWKLPSIAPPRRR